MRKRNFLFLAFAAFVLGTTIAGRADIAPQSNLIKSIQQNATTVQREAGIYQRGRVNRLVDRIVSDENRLHKLLEKHSCLTVQAEDLHRSVRTLSTVRQEMSLEKIRQAVRALSDTLSVLSGKSCAVEIRTEAGDCCKA